MIITPSNKPRQGWEKAFQTMAENYDDQLLDLGSEMQPWDEEEWQW